MSEGKYPRMPKPKDKSKRTLEIGEVELRPSKQAEWDEEEAGEYHKHEKKPAPESMLTKLGRVVSEASASVSKPWAKFMDDDEERP